MPLLTEHLLLQERAAFDAATRHPWLKLAGTSCLKRDDLRDWLIQDRLYALNYVSFIASLLSKISIPTHSDRPESIEWRVASILIDALTNIRRELAMFEEILRHEFGWRRGGEEARQETRAYADLFAGAAALNKSLLEGLAVLWATEKCYLEAWRYAKSCSSLAPKDDVLHNTLIPNWTSGEFAQFVDLIGALLDELSEANLGKWSWSEMERIWIQVLFAEKMFWPQV